MPLFLLAFLLPLSAQADVIMRPGDVFEFGSTRLRCVADSRSDFCRCFKAQTGEVELQLVRENVPNTSLGVWEPDLGDMNRAMDRCQAALLNHPHCRP